LTKTQLVSEVDIIGSYICELVTEKFNR